MASKNLAGARRLISSVNNATATSANDACIQGGIDVLEKLGVHSKLLEIAVKLEEIALTDDYFVSRGLYPNVDFYSGIIYKAIGFPVNTFTALFAMGRLPGWIAQWLEMHNDEDFRIGRPRQIYTGATESPYVPVEERS